MIFTGSQIKSQIKGQVKKGAIKVRLGNLMIPQVFI